MLGEFTFLFWLNYVRALSGGVKQFPQRKMHNILNVVVALPSRIISRLRIYVMNLKRGKCYENL